MIEDVTDVVITIDTDTGRKIFNIDVSNMTPDQSAALLKLLNRTDRTLGPRPEGGHSFEEQYWNGFIIPADVPVLVEGWLQSELADQYRSEPPNPAFVNIMRTGR